MRTHNDRVNAQKVVGKVAATMVVAEATEDRHAGDGSDPLLNLIDERDVDGRIYA
jgi:hypothetical protein